MKSSSKISILLAESNAPMRAHMKSLLQGSEFTIWEAADAASAERYLESPKLAVDILLADITLDRSSGWDLALSCASHRPKAKVLLMSSRYLDAVQDHGLYVRQGIYLRGVEFLPKPFGREELLHRLRELWKHGPTVRLESPSGVLRRLSEGNTHGGGAQKP